MAITRIGNPAIADVRGVNFRNIIINGDMSVSQRSTSQASITSSGYYTVDRYLINLSSLGTWTMSQETDVPTGQGFSSSLKMDCTTADASPAADDQFAIEHRVEGQNLQYLKFGTSSAKSLTLSFWVKSNKTGTYVASLMLNDASPKLWYSTQYTISASDTWEKKTITYPGNTAQAFDNDNGSSLRIFFWLGAGSNRSGGSNYTAWTAEPGSAPYNLCPGQVNLADSTSNEWYMTGVQLEAGSQASDFEFLPFDVNFKRCQRYYWGLWDKSIATANGPDGGDAAYYASSILYFSGQHPVRMRAQPSLDQASGTNYYKAFRSSADDDFNEFTLQTTNNRTNETRYQMNVASNISGTAGQAAFIRCNNANAYVFFDAEL